MIPRNISFLQALIDARIYYEQFGVPIVDLPTKSRCIKHPDRGLDYFTSLHSTILDTTLEKTTEMSTPKPDLSSEKIVEEYRTQYNVQQKQGNPPSWLNLEHPLVLGMAKTFLDDNLNFPETSTVILLAGWGDDIKELMKRGYNHKVFLGDWEGGFVNSDKESLRFLRYFETKGPSIATMVLHFPPAYVGSHYYIYNEKNLDLPDLPVEKGGWISSLSQPIANTKVGLVLSQIELQRKSIIFLDPFVIDPLKEINYESLLRSFLEQKGIEVYCAFVPTVKTRQSHSRIHREIERFECSNNGVLLINSVHYLFSSVDQIWVLSMSIDIDILLDLIGLRVAKCDKITFILSHGSADESLYERIFQIAADRDVEFERQIQEIFLREYS